MASAVGRNIGQLASTNVVQAVGTFVFWFLIIKVAGPETLGVSSYIASLVLIIATIVNLDISLGMKRSLGLAVAENDYAGFRQVLFSSLTIVTITVSTTVLLLAYGPFQILQHMGIDSQFSIIFLLLVISTPFQILFTEALISSLTSKDLMVPMIIGTIIRFPIFFIIVYMLNNTDIAAVIAYAALYFLTSFWYAKRAFDVSKRKKGPTAFFNNFLSNSKTVLSAGLAGWIPHLIYVVGAQLGIISIVSIEGDAAGGEFYLAWGIFLVIILLVMSISRVMHSSLGGMGDSHQQAKFLNYSMNIAFIFTLPIAASLLFFSVDFLNLIGGQLTNSAYVLSVFMVGVPLSIIIETSYYFVYGRNDQRTVLLLGLSGNIPRVILYFLLPPVLGIYGTAIAYLVGSVSQLLLTLYILKAHKVAVKFENFIIFTMIPMGIGLGFKALNINFVISTVFIIVLSLLAFIKFGLFTDIELRSLLYSGLPNKLADRVYPKLSRIIRIIH